MVNLLVRVRVGQTLISHRDDPLYASKQPLYLLIANSLPETTDRTCNRIDGCDISSEICHTNLDVAVLQAFILAFQHNLNRTELSGAACAENITIQFNLNTFVGTRLISTLQNEHAVLNLDKVESEVHSSLTEIGDVRDPQTYRMHLAGIDAVILLAAEHRDDVTPTSLYYDVNVDGMRNVLDAMDMQGVKNIFFTSSVAIRPGLTTFTVMPVPASSFARLTHMLGSTAFEA